MVATRTRRRLSPAPLAEYGSKTSTPVKRTPAKEKKVPEKVVKSSAKKSAKGKIPKKAAKLASTTSTTSTAKKRSSKSRVSKNEENDEPQTPHQRRISNISKRATKMIQMEVQMLETAHEKFHIAHPVVKHLPPIFEKFDYFEEPNMVVAILTYLSYGILILVGHVRDFLNKMKIMKYGAIKAEHGNKGCAPLYSDFEDFFTRNLYRRIRDCWNRPITNCPGGHCDVIMRESDDYNWNFTQSGEVRTCINLGSYNYLGFAQKEGPCADEAIRIINKYGVGTASPPCDLGYLDYHQHAEEFVAKFCGKEAALIVGMGFATNSTVIPALVDKGCIIFSDSLNHSSLVLGARVSGAKIQVFKHNNMANLEFLLRRAIAEGQPRTHKPWKKLLIIVEGIYSMEGVIVKLPELVALKKKYKAYVYLDEAHSIGAVGRTGRGVCEYWGVDTADIDIMMGTFTKSFGAAGGYIAADKKVIDALRKCAHSSIYAPSMSPPVVAQILSSMKIIAGMDGTDDGRRRLRQIAMNTRYFRHKLCEMGFIVYGSDDSPVIPMLLFSAGTIAAFSRMMLRRNVAVVVVGYPAVDIIYARARFCMSSSHTREDLDKVLKVLDHVGDVLDVKYSRQYFVKGKFVPEPENPELYE